MSSKRGRKRNDNLPPNRARDVQRAFRARRAAHLQALEERVSELEDENAILRRNLGMPPTTRPPLGKGPTGKDRPKDYERGGSQPIGLHSSRESSAAESPVSRASSLSPSTTVSLSSRPMHVIDCPPWNEPVLMGDHQQGDIAGPPDSSYQLAPMPAPVPIKLLQYPQYENSIPSSSRGVSSLFMNDTANNSHLLNKPLPDSYSNQPFNMRSDIREESFQRYPQQQAQFQGHEVNMDTHSTPPNFPPHGSHSNVQHGTQRDSSPYPHRRCLTDPQGFSIGQGFPHLPNPAQLQLSNRQNDFLRQQNNIGPSPSSSSSRSSYTLDERISSMT